MPGKNNADLHPLLGCEIQRPHQQPQLPGGLHHTGHRVNDLAFDEAIRGIHAKLRHPHLHLIEGREALVHLGGLTQDLIHPGEFGHAEMGANLARLMKEKLG